MHCKWLCGHKKCCHEGSLLFSVYGHTYHSLSKAIVLTIAVKVLGMLHYTLIPSHCIQVDIERLLFSLAVKLHNFWGLKIDIKLKMIDTSTKCLISVKSCNPYSSYDITAVGKCLADIWFAETLNWLSFTFLKIFICLKNGSLLHAQTGSLSVQFCM